MLKHTKLQLNNLIRWNVNSLFISTESCTDLNQHERGNMKDQFQPSYANQHEDNLARRIESLNNTTSLTKPVKMTNKQDLKKPHKI